MKNKNLNMPAVRFFGDLGRNTGYGNATINFCKAFSNSRINTKFVFREKVNNFPLFINNINNFPGKTSIDFYLHAPPYNGHSSFNYKIGYFYWEADSLPGLWVNAIKRLDEIWAPCELVRKACLKAGFRGPIHIVPTPSDIEMPDTTISIPSPLSSEYILSDDVFKFYSIFQWHERKGYRELLKAYFEEFKRDDNVILILKVNELGISFYTKDRIKIDILRIKKKMNLKFYPKVFLIDDIIPKYQIAAIHKYSNCYVAPHHGEGWGMPIHDAAQFGNHIIATRYGGVTEFFDENSMNIISHEVGPVSNMGWSKLYNSGQNWAHPKVSSIKENMRKVYSDGDSVMYKTKNAKIISSSMTIDSVSKIIEDRILSLRLK